MSSVTVPFNPENTISVMAATQIEGRAFDVGDFTSLDVLQFVRGVSGTSPQLTVAIQHSTDMRDWITKTTFGVVTSPSNAMLNLTGFLRYVRTLVTVTGTPGTFTYYVHGIAKD